MDVYGLTGGIGSGKSTVADLLEEYGIPVVSADELSRVVVARGSEGLGAVAKQFGPQVITDDGELDRRQMASIVFRDTERRRELEAILHPRIRDRFEQVLDALEKAGHEVAVYEVPLLFERNLQGEMKAVILVTAPEHSRVARVRARDDITETEVRARIAAQMDENTKRRRADYIIENDGSLDDLRREVEFLLARFLRVTHAARRPGSSHAAAGAIVSGATLPPSIGPDEDSAAPPPSRRPTAVPTGAPPSIAAPSEGPPPDSMGPPTLVDDGPGPRAGPDTIHPVTPPPSESPASPSVEAPTSEAPITEPPPSNDRITRVDGTMPPE